jgi:20S proteasome alpha/beta subunit
MFNFSANHLSLIRRTEYRSCVVFIMKDHHTQRIYRLYDFQKSLRIEHHVFYCVSGKVNSADKIYLVLETVKLDTKHSWSSKAPAPSERAGGSSM